MQAQHSSPAAEPSRLTVDTAHGLNQGFVRMILEREPVGQFDCLVRCDWAALVGQAITHAMGSHNPFHHTVSLSMERSEALAEIGAMSFNQLALVSVYLAHHNLIELVFDIPYEGQTHRLKTTFTLARSYESACYGVAKLDGVEPA